ncbi:hypothetical protein N836_24190 [Leptolyngbya sp. Heron Island J]|uniref:hypothetical protein n=1 Tax=Leptolyngbya sp. Heron Island J TaxID=1385935 RepID=UPI0003B98028|nr:hypothetical protein [Leptolyngbya sp. Heron Island J]ESA32891.1 hypothetical protein N836_24190 [Leptolyngbya sp. Heron Island J]
MNYKDKILVSLTDDTSRLQLFNDQSLEQLVAAAYEVDQMNIEGPYQPIFEELQFGFSVPKLGVLDGMWSPVGGGEKVEARFQVSGLGDGSSVWVDALWRGAIVARTVPANSKITAVQNEWTEVETSDGKVQQGAVQVTFAPPDNSAPSPKRLPITAALLIRDEGFSVTDLLSESKHIREQLISEGIQTKRDPDLPRRKPPLLVAWIIPGKVFDDADWPGGTAGMDATALRDARRDTAGKWLAQEGIGLVVTP